MKQNPPSSVAAIDLGSNSFHMIICNLNNGKLQIIDRLKEMVRLAAGLDAEKNLDLSTQAKALACLERFGQRIQNFPPNSVRIVGTNTLRTAKNAETFLAKAEQAVGFPIDIISGIEEARLIYQGVANSLGSNAKTRFVMDIGGGSTEYIIGQHDVPHVKESLNVGCVTISQRCFKDGTLSKKSFKKAVLLAEQHLEPFQDRFHRRHWEEAIGASGSLKAVDAVLHATGYSNNGITREGLENLVSHCLKLGSVDSLNLPELSVERRPVFIGGLAIVYASFKTLGIEQMTVADGALREGLIHDLLGRIYNSDIRSQTSQTIAAHYRADLNHAQRIKETLRYMVEQLQEHPFIATHEASSQFLEWAADLHEIGQDIAHSQYHKHSAYIIEHGDLAGFSKQDQQVLAAIVRNHRKRLSLTRFANLHTPWTQYAPLLTILLRLAVVLHRNRHTEHPNFSIKFKGANIYLRFPEGWLKHAPLTEADLQNEAEYLRDLNFRLVFH